MKILSLIFFIFMLHISAFSQEAKPFIINNDNISDFSETIKDSGKINFIVFQADFKKADAKTASVLMNWVEKGGCLWFYDSRLAPLFGMKNSPMNFKDLESKSMSAEFGSGKISGAPLGAQSHRGTPITVGVRRVVVFVPAVGKDLYSAVALEDGILPVLQVPEQEKSLVCAVKKIGKGNIIFKPLLWEKQYDGKVFQRRIINYSVKGI